MSRELLNGVGETAVLDLVTEDLFKHDIYIGVHVWYIYSALLSLIFLDLWLAVYD